jgi:hypothetical protein
MHEYCHCKYSAWGDLVCAKNTIEQFQQQCLRKPPDSEQRFMNFISRGGNINADIRYIRYIKDGGDPSVSEEEYISMQKVKAKS